MDIKRSIKDICTQCGTEWEYSLPVLPSIEGILLLEDGNIKEHLPRLVLCLCGELHESGDVHPAQSCIYGDDPSGGYYITIANKSKSGTEHMLDISANPQFDFPTDKSILEEYDRLKQQFLLRGKCMTCLDAAQSRTVPPLVSVAR